MNWSKIIRRLQAHGLTQQQIADACKCSQTAVSELLTGATKSPSYVIGAALQALLKKHDGSAR